MLNTLTVPHCRFNLKDWLDINVDFSYIRISTQWSQGLTEEGATFEKYLLKWLIRSFNSVFLLYLLLMEQKLNQPTLKLNSSEGKERSSLTGSVVDVSHPHIRSVHSGARFFFSLIDLSLKHVTYVHEWKHEIVNMRRGTHTTTTTATNRWSTHNNIK